MVIAGAVSLEGEHYSFSYSLISNSFQLKVNAGYLKIWTKYMMQHF